MANFPEFSPTQLLTRLADAGVDFVVIGGIAVNAHGYIYSTQDLDIAFSTEASNLQALGHLLVDLNAYPRGVDRDLPFIADSRTLRQVELMTLSTDEGPLDIHVRPAGAPDYATLRANADVVDLDGAKVRIASIGDLIAMKRAAGRPKDLVHLEGLEIARRAGGTE